MVRDFNEKSFNRAEFKSSLRFNVETKDVWLNPNRAKVGRITS